ncbi:MAG: hypothetical protein ACYC5K_08780 [Saccharofermentanales bacterium]
MDTNQYDWVDFYKEFSHLLLAYKSNRQELIDKVKSIYNDTGINLPKLEKDARLELRISCYCYPAKFDCERTLRYHRITEQGEETMADNHNNLFSARSRLDCFVNEKQGKNQKDSVIFQRITEPL